MAHRASTDRRLDKIEVVGGVPAADQLGGLRLGPRLVGVDPQFPGRADCGADVGDHPLVLGRFEPDLEVEMLVAGGERLAALAGQAFARVARAGSGNRKPGPGSPCRQAGARAAGRRPDRRGRASPCRARPRRSCRSARGNPTGPCRICRGARSAPRPGCGRSGKAVMACAAASTESVSAPLQHSPQPMRPSSAVMRTTTSLTPPRDTRELSSTWR